MRTANRVAKNTGILYAKMGITVFISLYSTRLILNALGVRDFGLFNLVGGAIAMLTFLNNAMASATQRYMSFSQGEGNDEKQKNIFNVSMVLHLITAVLVVLIMEVAGYFLFNGILKIPIVRVETAKLIFHFMVISTFFTIVSVPYEAVINAHENMFIFAIIGIVEALIKLTIAIYISNATSDKLMIYGLLMAILSVFLMILRQIYCHARYKEVILNFKKYYNITLSRGMIGFAGWSLLGATSSMIGFYGQGIVLNMFFGTIVNAAQGIANQINGQLSAFANTMLKALNPIIAKSEGAGNRQLMLKAAMFGSKVSFFLFMFFVIPVFIEMHYVFEIWLKDVPDFAIIFCRLFLIRNLIDQLIVNLNSMIAAVGTLKRYQIIISIFYILPLIVSYIAFSFGFPPYTIYVFFILFTIVIGFFNIYFSRLFCNLPVAIFLKEVVLRCVITFLIVYILSTLPIIFMNEGLIRFIIVLIISAISFFIMTWFIGLSSKERYNLNQLINSLINRIVYYSKEL